MSHISDEFFYNMVVLEATTYIMINATIDYEKKALIKNMVFDLENYIRIV